METRRKWDNNQERNGDMQMESETEQERKRNGDIQKWRGPGPERQKSGGHNGEERMEEDKKGRRDRGPLYDIQVPIRSRATLKVHYW